MGSEIFGDSWIINKTDFLNTIGDYFCELGNIVAKTTLNCVSITFYDYFRILTSFLDKSLNKNRKFFHNLVQHKKLEKCKNFEMFLKNYTQRRLNQGPYN